MIKATITDEQQIRELYKRYRCGDQYPERIAGTTTWVERGNLDSFEGQPVTIVWDMHPADLRAEGYDVQHDDDSECMPFSSPEWIIQIEVQS